MRIPKATLAFFEKHESIILFFILSMISIPIYLFYLSNGLGLAYNDARSHLDISRRVVENLKPGFSQLGSVWLPLPHILMLLTVWNSTAWHTGLAGALVSMVAFVFTGILIYKFLKELHVDMLGRLTGLLVFATNINVLYMQSTAMTELLLLGTMTAGAYELMMWHKEETLFRMIKAAFWIMLSTLVRYDGWFLFLFAICYIFVRNIRKYGYKATEGMIVFFATLAGFGVFLWFFWNLMIFKDPLYFAFGPFSANAQQQQLEAAGALATKHNLPFSLQTYLFAMMYNSGIFSVILSFIGMIVLWLDKKMDSGLRLAATVLLVPFIFNIVALYLGHSVLYVAGLAGESWFNVRYGLMMIPSIAVFIGYLIHRARPLRYVLIGLLLFVSFFSFVNHDAVTIDDAVVGASGKNVKEVSGWLAQNAKDKDGFVLLSVASHDAIVFSSGLPMSKFIHEGTGVYWHLATKHPEQWARWIILRTYDDSDMTYRELKNNKSFKQNYRLVHKYPFADIYELKPELVKNLHIKPEKNIKNT